MTEKSAGEQNDKDQRKTPALEWIFAVIGLVLVVSVIGFLVYQITVNEGKPPSLQVRSYETVQSGSGFLVKFVIENAGDEAAADVTVVGELKNGQEDIETADVTVDYVPAHSEKRGGLFFNENPTNFELKLRAKGYNEP